MSLINATDSNLDDLRRIVLLLWGNNVQDETFRRWTQGKKFNFNREFCSFFIRQSLLLNPFQNHFSLESYDSQLIRFDFFETKYLKKFSRSFERNNSVTYAKSNPLPEYTLMRVSLFLYPKWIGNSLLIWIEINVCIEITDKKNFRKKYTQLNLECDFRWIYESVSNRMKLLILPCDLSICYLR